MTLIRRLLLMAGFAIFMRPASGQLNQITESIDSTGFSFNKGHINHVFQLVQGKIAGLSVSKPGGDPNGFYDVRVRGLRTFTSNTMPVIVIDGLIQAFPENTEPLDIHAITLITNASEASQYGLPGGSGIMMIETKQGEAGKTEISYHTQLSAETAYKNRLFMDAREWRALADELDSGTDFGVNTDWPDEITRTAFSQVHNLSLKGGNNFSQYRASVNFREGRGIQINSGYSQINGRIGFRQKALKERLVMNLNAAATQRKSHFGFSNAFKYALLSNPTSPVKSDDPAFDPYDGYFTQALFDYYNPVHIVKSDRNEGLTRLFSFSSSASLRFFSGLTLNVMYALQHYNTTGIRYFDNNEPWGGISQNGFATRQERDAPMQQISGTLNYERSLGVSTEFDFTLGFTHQTLHTDGFYATQNNININDLSFKSLFNEIKGLNDIKKTYFTEKKYSLFFSTGIVKRDLCYVKLNGSSYSSSLLSSNNLQFFGGLNAGLNINEIINPSTANYLSIKAGYGITGNTLPGDYLSYYRWGTHSNLSTNGYDFDDFHGTTGNESIRIPVISEINAGLDFIQANSKLSGSLTFYSATVKNPCIVVEVPMPPNLYPTMMLNLGKIRDSGLELVINRSWQAVGWSVDMMLTAAYSLTNKPISLSGKYNGAELNYGTKELGNLGSPGQNQIPLVRISEGAPFGELVALEYKRIDEAGNLVFIDQPGTTGGIDQSDRIIAGNALPKFIMGYGADFQYKKFDATIFFRGVFGHKLLNTYRALYEVPGMISTYNLPKTAGSLKNHTSGVYMSNSSGILSDRHIENASFLSLDNVSIGYRIYLSQNSFIHLYIAGNNLFFITRYRGNDPNPRYGDSGNYNYNPLIPGIERTNTWFRTRSFTLGARLTI